MAASVKSVNGNGPCLLLFTDGMHITEHEGITSAGSHGLSSSRLRVQPSLPHGIGDKTQITVLSLTARTGKPLAVFTGALLGLAAVTVLGVTVGALAVTFIPGEWVSRAAAVGFIIIGLFILWSSWKGGGKEEAATETPGARSSLGIAAGTSGLLFVAELGDKSQLAVIGLTAQFEDPVSVFAGAIAGLALVTLSGALLGQAITG